MESKHTPGPWVAKVDSYIITAASTNGLIIRGTSNLEARLHYNGNLIAETVAPCNRNLIAAAPDMYEALRFIKIHFEAYCELNEAGVNLLASMVKEVLDKANGVTPTTRTATSLSETKNQQ